MSVFAITRESGYAVIDVKNPPDVFGIAADTFEAVAESGVGVDLILHTSPGSRGGGIVFTVKRGDEERALSALREAYSEYTGTKVLCAGYAVKISLSGAGMQGKAGVAARLLKCLWREDLRVYGISNSEIKISVLVAEEYADEAMRSILGEFELDV